VLRRVLDAAVRVVRGLGRLAIVAAACASAAWLVWAIDAPPGGTSEWADRIVVLALLLAPPAVLLVFVVGLRRLFDVAERTHGLSVGTWKRETDGERGVLTSLIRLVRLVRLVLTSRDVLSPYTLFTFALRPAILLAALAAATAAVLEVPVSLIAILTLLAS
jgi:hypothetical protein